HDRVIELVNDAFLERDDAVVGDVDVFGADFGATLGNVAEADVESVFEKAEPVSGVQGMHFQAGDADHEARAAKRLALGFVVIAKDVADILAEKTLDALAEFLDAIDFFLAHAPGAIGSIGRPGLKRWDELVDAIVPGDIGNEILNEGERLDRLNSDW